MSAAQGAALWRAAGDPGRIARMIDQLLDLIATHGARQYGGERVSQEQHALQSALLAETEGVPASLVVAALFHDIGHMLHKDGENAAERGIDDRHEALGGKQLRRVFGPAVAEPVRLHVDAKRYLCASDPGYFGALSAASVRSLELQGGPFSAAEAAAFIARPYAADAVRLRRWDDTAKVAGLATPPIAHFRRHIEAALAQHAAGGEA
jgi:[1-hydroxy-2-(trimethylamino)ethyl]phosphonate dioxygenase